MKRKHSISLGISGVWCIALIAFFFYDILMLEGDSGSFVAGVVGVLLWPFIILLAIGTIFLFIAFFTNIFGLAITAGILFSVACVLGFKYILLVIPLVITTFIGCSFCYKLKKIKKEEEEDERYRKQHPQGRVNEKMNSSTYVQRQVLNQNGYQQRNTYVDENRNDMQRPMDPYSSSYKQNNGGYGDATSVNSYYAPMDSSLANNPNTLSPSYPVNYDQTYQNPNYVQNQYDSQGTMEPVNRDTPVDLVYGETTANMTANNGFFDDFGNFHSDGGS